MANKVITHAGSALLWRHCVDRKGGVSSTTRCPTQSLMLSLMSAEILVTRTTLISFRVLRRLGKSQYVMWCLCLERGLSNEDWRRRVTLSIHLIVDAYCCFKSTYCAGQIAHSLKQPTDDPWRFGEGKGGEGGEEGGGKRGIDGNG